MPHTKMTPTRLSFNLILLSIFLPFLLSAQVRVGIGGGGYFGLRGQGINAGLQIQKEISEFSSLTVQLGLTDKPSNLPTKNLNPDFDYVAGHLSYLIVPIEYQYYLPFKNLRAGAFGGPYFAYGLKATVLKKLDDFNFEKMNLDFEAHGIRQFDIGVHLGIGLELELPRFKRMFIRMNYALGLMDTDLDTASNYQEGVGVLMGLLVPVGKIE